MNWKEIMQGTDRVCGTVSKPGSVLCPTQVKWSLIN